jgi:HSP20 family protein
VHSALGTIDHPTRIVGSDGYPLGSYRSEFRYGEFSRDLALPTGVDPGKVDAKYKDGILEVRVPWKEEKQAKSTKVQISRS